MLEAETSGYAPKVEIVFKTDQEGPFAVNKAGTQWQLSVNRAYFTSKGFLPDEIDGAIYLEEERLGKQVGANSLSAVDGVRKWQNVARDNPKASTFKMAFERLATLASLEERDGHKAALARRYLERFASRPPSSTNTDQLFSTILLTGLGKETFPTTKAVETVTNNLKKPETIEDRNVSPFDALISPDLSFASRSSWFEARFLPRLEFLERQDRLKKEQKTENQKPENNTDSQDTPEPTPQATQDEFEQRRGREEKGKGKPIFIINPSFTGFWEEDSFDSMDEQTGRLIKSSTQRMRTAITRIDQVPTDGTKRTISGNTGTDLFSLPLAPGFQLTQEGLANLSSQGIGVFSDVEGHTFLQSTSNTKITAEIAMIPELSNFGINSRNNEISNQTLPDEISQNLSRISNLPSDSLGKLQEWKDFIGNYFKYPTDDQVESMYATVDGSSSRLSTMAQEKLLDCYLAREFFIAGLKRLNLDDVEWRGVNGHYIAASQRDGTAHISSGTGHAWIKVRVPGEKNWIIFDPTPPGDPVHEGESAMDEFGEATPQEFSEQNLADLEKEARDARKSTVETQDHYLLEFAQEAGVSPAEAQKILTILAQVDQLKDKQGRNILARLREQFDRIIEKYTVLRQENMGDVEMSRGQSLDDPVAAYIDLRSGSSDPLGFERRRIVEDTEQYYGGLDLEIVTDGSGSMNESLGGKVKFKVQQEMGYLLHRALHRFSQEAQRRKLRLVTPLKIRSSQYMFRGNDIEIIKPLSEELTPAQMALLWKKSAENIGGGTPAHLGLQVVLDKLPPDEVKLLQDKKLLKIVALISDGDYDDDSRVRNLINSLRALNVVVAEFPITDSRSLDELPANVAAKVIEAAATLMPERVGK